MFCLLHPGSIVAPQLRPPLPQISDTAVRLGVVSGEKGLGGCEFESCFRLGGLGESGPAPPSQPCPPCRIVVAGGRMGGGQRRVRDIGHLELLIRVKDKKSLDSHLSEMV